jgi:hypothetical protein
LLEDVVARHVGDAQAEGGGEGGELHCAGMQMLGLTRTSRFRQELMDKGLKLVFGVANSQ